MTKHFYNKVTRDPIVVEDDAVIADFPDYAETQPEFVETADYLAKLDIMMRRMRNAELARTDHLMLSDMNPTQELIDYRQALRDAPADSGWPENPPDIRYKGDATNITRILDGDPI